MGKVFDDIDEQLQSWIARQPMFFVGTAPRDADGHVNVSPKGPIDSLRVLTPTTVAYLDLVGSGAEENNAESIDGLPAVDLPLWVAE